jgi:uncharacterized protein YndB with AHSA1/START domain
MNICEKFKARRKNMSGKNEASADLDFVISRVFDAPRALVFKMWTDAKHMARWWGPRGFPASDCKMDVRPGGAYRIVMNAPDGAKYPLKGFYREISPPAKLVFTMDCSEHPAAWHDMVKPNRTKDEPNPAGEMLTTVTFEENSGKTTMTIRMRMASPEIRASMVKMGMNDGWSQSLDKLAELLADEGAKS